MLPGVEVRRTWWAFAKLVTAKIHEKQNKKLQLVNFWKRCLPLGCCNFILTGEFTEVDFSLFQCVKLVDFLDFLLKVFSLLSWCGFFGRRCIYSFKRNFWDWMDSVGFGKRSLCPTGGWPCQHHSLLSLFNSITISYKNKLYKWVVCQQFNWKWFKFTRRFSWTGKSSSKSIRQRKLIWFWTPGAMSLVLLYTHKI